MPDADETGTQEIEEINWTVNLPGKYFEPLNYPSKDEKPISKEPVVIELKPLPDKLKYAYLGTNHTMPVIISSELQPEQEQSLIEMLQQHKKAIG
ncbi:hypothetical protein, partial [Enterococcus sp. 2CBP]|uniref:hypothetical protein n=1 Tax=Enterococcus sp. 2CBP TaxID=2800793 RepID=UPI002905BFCB